MPIAEIPHLIVSFALERSDEDGARLLLNILEKSLVGDRFQSVGVAKGGLGWGVSIPRQGHSHSRRYSPPDVFFFSSRRRHTRLQGDWSSDVCSSDLRFERVDLYVVHALCATASSSCDRCTITF